MKQATDIPAIIVRGVVKSYGTVQALQGVDLSIEKGDFFALLGPNGAGKSTLINIISSLAHKSSGTIQVLGKDLDADRAAVKTCLGVIPQEFNFNIFEKVIDIIVQQAGYYGIKRSDALVRAEFLLKKLDLWEKRNAAARTLSGGQKRRLLIVRGLIHDPEILILDEPTAGVDVEVRHIIWEFIQELHAKGTTIILTTHYLEEAQNLCKTLAIINQGKIIEQCSVAQFLATHTEAQMCLELIEPHTVLPRGMEKLPYRCVLTSSERVTLYYPKGTPAWIIFNQLSEIGVRFQNVVLPEPKLEDLFLKQVSKNNAHIED